MEIKNSLKSIEIMHIQKINRKIPYISKNLNNL